MWHSHSLMLIFNAYLIKALSTVTWKVSCCQCLTKSQSLAVQMRLFYCNLHTILAILIPGSFLPSVLTISSLPISSNTEMMQITAQQWLIRNIFLYYSVICMFAKKHCSRGLWLISLIKYLDIMKKNCSVLVNYQNLNSLS